MSEQDSSMSMNSLMQAIYGDHKTQYIAQHQQYSLDQVLPQFMQSLIKHLIQLCVTQGSVDSAQRTLSAWIQDVRLNPKNPRPAVQGFMKQFMHLYLQQSQKISKYGQKKLKYLTQTVSKQIFTQIMRMSCDLKLQSVNRNNNNKAIHQKNNNVCLLMFCMRRIYANDKFQAFKIIKKSYYQNINKEDNFICNFQKSIDVLQRISVRNNHDRLCKGFNLWRVKSIEQAEIQSNYIYNQAKAFYKSVLSQIVKSWQFKSSSWLNVIIDNISRVINDSLGNNNDGVQIDFIVNPQLQQNNSLDYSALSSHRSVNSNFSMNNNNISVQQYLKTQRIRYDNNNKFLAIPVITSQNLQLGLVRISWFYQLPIIVFNRTLKLAQILKKLIQSISKVSTRLMYYHRECQQNSWQEKMYSLAIKDGPLEFSSVQEILSAVKISHLEIYHSRNENRTCIKYGNINNQMKIPEDVYKLIWNKLETVSQFTLNRQQNMYEIAKLDGISSGSGSGFCRYSFQQTEQKNDRQPLDNNFKRVIITCIVPLLTRNFGKIGCPVCNIKIVQLNPALDDILSPKKQTQPYYNNIQKNKSRQKSLKKYDNDLNHNFQLVLQIKNACSMTQIQRLMQKYFKNCFHGGVPIYSRILYFISEQKCTYIYKTNNKNKYDNIIMKTIQIPKNLINENLVQIYPQNCDKMMKDVINLMQQNPLFQDPQIYLYQIQKRRPLSIIPKKIGRKALFLLATYQSTSISISKLSQLLNQKLQYFVTQLQDNKNLFIKQDSHKWATNTIIQSKINRISTFQLNLNQIQINQISSINSIINLNFTEYVNKLISLCVKTKIKQHFVWKVSNNAQNCIQLINNGSYTHTQKYINKFPQKLKNESIRSHNFIKGVHRIVHLSKNYGQKLQQFLSYIPIFQLQDQKIAYANVICDKIEQLGQYTDSSYTEVSQFLQNNYKIHKCKWTSQYQFLSLPIEISNDKYKYKNNKQCRYVLLFIIDKQLIVTQQTFKSFTLYMTKAVNHYLNIKKQQNRKKISIYLQNLQRQTGILNKNNKKNKIKKSVYKFIQNVKFVQLRSIIFKNKILNTHINNNYRAIKQAFRHIWVQSNQYQLRYKNGCKFIVNKLQLIYGIRPFIYNLQICTYKRRGLYKLTTTLNKIQSITVIHKILFIKLKQNQQNAKQQQKCNKNQSILKIIHTIQKIKYRNISIFFYKSWQSLLSLQRSLRILQQQFKLIDPKSIKSCIFFLSGRINLMLAQSYAMPIKIQLMSSTFFQKKEYKQNNLQIENFQCIKNSTFGFKIYTQGQGQGQTGNLQKNRIQNMILNVLDSILPKWQTKNRKHTCIRLNILFSLLNQLFKDRKRLIFNIFNSYKYTLNMNNLLQLKQKNEMQIQQMNKLKQMYNTNINIKNRQKHRKQIQEIKQQSCALQNQLYRIGIDMRIKSKTNAVYQMIKFVNNHEGFSMQINKQNTRFSQNIKIASVNGRKMQKNPVFQLKQVRESRKEDQFRHILQVLPLWTTNVSKIINQNKKYKLSQCFNQLTNFIN